MKLRRPSPSMVVALIALVLSTSGSAVAAVSYASRAGSVDGHSAVGASSSLRHAAGNLVATAKGGSTSGQIPARFVAGVQQGSSQPFVQSVQVSDNANLAPAALVGVPGVGKTSVVRGLAQRIADGVDVACFEDKIVIAIEPAAMLAGTGVRGSRAR